MTLAPLGSTKRFLQDNANASIDSKIRKKFVRDALTEHGEMLLDIFESDIMKLKLINSEELLSSLDYDVLSGNNIDGTLSIKFSLHGRFQDIGAGRKMESTSSNRDYATKKKRKAKKWYTHNVFGSLNNLIYSLLYGLTHETKQLIKNDLIS
jgi:hypothetical protein